MAEKTFTKHVLSGSTNGRPIAVNNTLPSTADTIHTTPTGTTGIDEIWLWAANTTTQTRIVHILHGGIATSDKLSKSIAANEGVALVSPGLILTNGLIMKAYATVSESVNVVGFVNRINPT